MVILVNLRKKNRSRSKQQIVQILISILLTRDVFKKLKKSAQEKQKQLFISLSLVQSLKDRKLPSSCYLIIGFRKETNLIIQFY